MTLIVAQGGPLGAELLMEDALDLVGRQAVGGCHVPRRNDDRRLTDNPVASVDPLAELGQRLQAVARARLPVTFWADFSARLAAFAAFFFDFDASAAVRRTACRSSSSDRWAYQMSMVPILANPAIASR